MNQEQTAKQNDFFKDWVWPERKLKFCKGRAEESLVAQKTSIGFKCTDLGTVLTCPLPLWLTGYTQSPNQFDLIDPNVLPQCEESYKDEQIQRKRQIMRATSTSSAIRGRTTEALWSYSHFPIYCPLLDMEIWYLMFALLDFSLLLVPFFLSPINTFSSGNACFVHMLEVLDFLFVFTEARR